MADSDEHSNFDLTRVEQLCARACILLAAAGLLMIVLGVWVDWRWFPTAAVSFAVAVVSALVGSSADEELRRRGAKPPRL